MGQLPNLGSANSSLKGFQVYLNGGPGPCQLMRLITIWRKKIDKINKNLRPQRTEKLILIQLSTKYT